MNTLGKKSIEEISAVTVLSKSFGARFYDRSDLGRSKNEQSSPSVRAVRPLFERCLEVAVTFGTRSGRKPRGKGGCRV